MPDDNLFGDSSSDDTDDLFAQAKPDDKPIAKKKASPKKKRLQKKKRKLDAPDADNDSDDDASLSGGKGGGASGLSDSDGGGKPKKKAAAKTTKKKKAKKSDGGGKKMSRKEKMEALARKRHQSTDEEEEIRAPIPRSGDKAESGGEDKHYESAARDRGYDSEERNYEDLSDDSVVGVQEALCDDDAPENPIMAAVHRMKRKKKTGMRQSEKEEVAREFLKKMTSAADDDDTAIQEKRPAIKKLAMLPEVIDMLTKRDLILNLLEFDLLVIIKRWVQPLPNGTLGNITVRQQILAAIAKIGTGENGISSNDLKRSSLGKTVMSLYMHKSETPEMKRQHKSLIEQWSRPIFKKSGNMRDLETVHSSRRNDDMGLAGIARANSAYATAQPVNQGRSSRNEKDLTSIIAGKGSGAQEIGSNRVRVPYSKGFQFTHRPMSRVIEPDEKKGRPGRDKLSKRMVEKKPPSVQKSAELQFQCRR